MNAKSASKTHPNKSAPTNKALAPAQVALIQLIAQVAVKQYINRLPTTH